MKKYILMLMSTLLYIGCSVNEPTQQINIGGAGIIETNGPQKVNIANNVSTITYSINDEIIGSSAVVDNAIYLEAESYNVVSIYNAKTNELLSNEIVGGTNKTSVKKVVGSSYSLIDVKESSTILDVTGMSDEFIINYPEEGNNWDGDYYDFMYVSNGETFTIYPIYSNTSNHLVLGLFYFDKNLVKHDLDIYEMDDDWYADGEKKSTRQYHYLVNKTLAKGIDISIPKGLVFGLYVYTTNTADHAIKYSAMNYNTCISSHKTHKDFGPAHVTTYAYNGFSYVGFDDGHSAVADFNDWIIVMNPEQELMVNPTLEKIQNKLDSTPYIVTVENELIHITTEKLDIESRLKDPYPYLRINIPLNAADTDTLDISLFAPYILAQDDLRITIANDEDSITNKIEIIRDNNKIIINCSSEIENGLFQIKLELRPNNEYYDNIIQIMKEMKDQEFEWETLIY